MSKELESWKTMDDVDRDFIRRSLEKKALTLKRFCVKAFQIKEKIFANRMKNFLQRRMRLRSQNARSQRSTA